MIPQAGIERYKLFRGKVTKAEMKGDRGFTRWSPDFICNLDPKSGDTVFGRGLGAYPRRGRRVGQDSSVAMWWTPKGIGVFGPRYFGFDFDYRPIEEIPRDRPKFGNN
jgi:hypothetical protein